MRHALFVVLLAAGPAAAQRPQLQVAVTFNDVPSVAIARCTRGAARALNQRLLQAIERNGMPAAALVVAGPGGCGAWLAAGHEVGSHTFTHRDVNTAALAMYLDDVDRARDRLAPTLRARGASLHDFRHPFLHTGQTRAQKDSLDGHLRREGYDIALVTIANQEWVFAEAYARATARGDARRMARIVPAYLAHIGACHSSA